MGFSYRSQALTTSHLERGLAFVVLAGKKLGLWNIYRHQDHREVGSARLPRVVLRPLSPRPPSLAPRLLALTGGALALGVSLFVARPTTASETKSGSSPSDGPKPEPSQRIYADAFLTWIYQTPTRELTPIGYIRGGDSVALRADGATPAGTRVKRGCGRGWYAVAPVGYVCLDHTASLGPTRYSESMQSLRATPGAYPFDYALSMGTPTYRRMPTPSEWERRERIFGEAKSRALPPHWRGHEELVSDLKPTSEAPFSFLDQGGSVSHAQETRLLRRDAPFGSMLAFRGAFESDGRQFLQSADGTILPTDRVRIFTRSKFKGIELSGGDARLPLGWPRKKTRLYTLKSTPACAIDGSGTKTQALVESDVPAGKLATKAAQLPQECLIPTESYGAPRQRLGLTGRAADVSGTRFFEIRTEGEGPSQWAPSRYLFIAEKQTLRAAEGTSMKWIHFSIGQGTLVTYEGETPTFATLASPGIGGVPAPGADPLSTRTTPVGTYRIQFKHRTDDMSPEQTEDRSFWIADVPHAMYFKQPFAIHVAYWHESFGEPMSGGCINVSPLDGERLFAFSDPPLPPDWYGVGASRALGYGTTLVIHR